MDETTFSLDYPLRKCWMKRGHQMRLPAYTGNRQLSHLIGAYDWATDEVHAHLVERKTSARVVEFIEWLLVEVYPDDPVMLVLDNVSYHRSADVLALLSLFEPRVHVIWLPKYSPDMNPIERFWLHLKQQVYANRLYLSHSALLDAIQLWLAFQNMLDHPFRFVSAKSFQ
jgi:transposase